MSAITICTRSFHPDANFGAGGLGFEGDDRGFSFDLGDSARIFHIMSVNLQSGRVESVICDSDPSANAVADKAINAAVDSVPLGELLPDVPVMENDYSQPRKKPRHEETYSITTYTEDGDQTANIFLKYAGKNFAFYFADTDAGHEIFGGPLSNEERNDTGSGSYGWVPYNGVVPDLDVSNQIYLMLDRADGKAYAQMTMTGDGFPNAEGFIIDSGGAILGMATHIRTGTALTQLPGGRAIRMCMTQLQDVDWSNTDTLGSATTANAVYDYMSFGTTEVAEGTVGRVELNRAHLARDASGNLLRDIQDHIPIPSPRNYEWLWE
ncbi:MAG: hypothetical protein AAF727_11350 [Pseudomonadota bacterium]